MSWEQLEAILKDARQTRAEEAAAEPVACPNDGEPLQRDPSGRLRCPYDGWTPDAQ